MKTLEPSPTEGFLLVQKPQGISSFSVVRRVRRLTQVKRVGHCGTLDPFATGLLILAIGRSYTRQLEHFQGLPKTYRCTMVLGAETDTYDPEGKTKQLHPVPFLSEAEVQRVFQKYLGKIAQIPPVFSAKKIRGKRAYTLARKGEEVSFEPSWVEIYALELLELNPGVFPTLTFRCHCSKGTYIRSLVRDFGKSLGTVAYALTLEREKIGDFHVKHALAFEALSQESIAANLWRELVS